MKLKDLLSTLRTINYATVEIRDQDNNTLFTAPTISPALKHYTELKVSEWFPNDLNKDISFTVLLVTADEEEA